MTSRTGKPRKCYVVRACAPNDVNGNPRRVFLLYATDGRYLGCVDEGYAFSSERLAARSSGLVTKDAIVIGLGSIPTTPGFYRDAIRD